MKWKGLTRGWTAVLCSFVLIGAGAVLVTPAANALSSINWGSVWKHQLQPRADKRYYTKAASNAKYVAKPKKYTGIYMVSGQASAAGVPLGGSISFGAVLPTAPAVHFIPSGTTPPAGCSGTVAAPSAAPGNLCVFEAVGNNVSNPNIYNGGGTLGSNKFGAFVGLFSAAAGNTLSYGSWAVAPGAPARTGSAHFRGSSSAAFGR